MSKMSQLHMELSEKAYELGFQSIEDAQAHGYDIDYENKTLVDGRELAHKDWLKEREEVIKDIENASVSLERLGDEFYRYQADKLRNAVDFIKKGEI